MDKQSEQIGELKAMVKSHGDQLEGIHAELKTMNSTLIRNTESLEFHIRRTEQNEDAIKQLRDERATDANKVHERLAPLERQHIIQHAYFRLLVFCLGLPAGIYYTIRIFKEFVK